MLQNNPEVKSENRSALEQILGGRHLESAHRHRADHVPVVHEAVGRAGPKEAGRRGIYGREIHI